MTDGSDDAPAVCEGANLCAPIARQDFGPDVVDIERARDRLAGIACFAAEQDRLYACVIQPLNRRPCAGPKPILEGEQTKEAIPLGDEEYATPLRFELGDAGVGDGDADLLLDQECAAPDDDFVAVGRKGGHAETRVNQRRADVLGPYAASTRGTQNRSAERVTRGHFRTGSEREDASDLLT
jgi:hypothetical protein